MKVLRLIDSLDPRDGGPPHGVRRLDAVMRAKGHRVVTLAMHKAGADYAQLHPDDQVLPATRRLGRGFSWRLLSEAWREAPDSDVIVMHGFYVWLNLVGYLVASRFGKPLVFQPHGVFERYQRTHSVRSKAVFDALVGRVIRRRTDMVLVASQAEIVGVRDMFRDTEVAVVGIGVDQVEGRSESLMHDPIRLLSMSRIAPKKRIDISIRAVAKLKELGVAVTLVVAGEGDAKLKAELLRLCQELEVEEDVEFIGHVSGSEKLKVLAGADLFILPSENENFAISVAEAMAAGLPCVVTEAVAMSEFVARGAGAVICTPDEVQLSEAVARLATDSQLYCHSARNARSMATRELGWEKVAESWEDQLHAIVSDKRRASVGAQS